MNDELLCIVEISESAIPEGCPREILEVRIRRDGQVWEIHKNDKDPFPSNPHAHNKELGLKMDLSNGRLYSGRRDTKKATPQKHLLDIRAQAEQKGIALPPLSM